MQVKYDRKLLIAIARSRKASQWQNKEMLWSEFLDKLASTTRTRETVAEYAALPKGERDTVKDVGGFVGGYVLGDCVDRNPFGLKILKELYLMPNATVLLGNHEYMMLDALTKASPENEYIRRWYRNGGDITHARLLHCSKAYRQEMLDIIRALPVNLEIRCGGTDYLLVHGGPLGYRHRYDDPVRDSVWMRLDETTALPERKTVIFGHTPTCHYQSDSPMRIYHAADGLYAQNAG